MISRHFLIAGALVCASLVACGGSTNPCEGVTGTCTEFAAGTSESTISNAISGAKDGTTFAFDEGTFTFTNEISIANKNITIKGSGQDATILDFGAQAAGAEGILAQDGSDGIAFTALTVRDPAGNGVKVVGSTGVKFTNMKVVWTNQDKTKHGAYGVYPVQSKQVLIDGVTVEGAADAAIYVGQSDGIVVRNSTARLSVAGIEIENSFNADVYNNTSTLNAGGILVFDLPGLQQKGGHNVRVYNNKIINNTTTNFGAAGSTVSLVPTGTGVLVMANHDVEVFGNTISGNGTTGVAVVSFLVTQISYSDATYNPFPSKVHIHDNVVADPASPNGTNPDIGRQLGLLLYAHKSDFPGGHVPEMLYDGIVDGTTTSSFPNNSMSICFKNNTASTATFANLHFDQCNTNCANLGTIITTDITPNACSLDALPAVTFPGL
ncbi:MAG: right-handed parallel beta-helix repeat-containing protein [Deltaproteobacteria bacterium]|nr:right-handed parallel beta-helix repeat-containing protein [Deltaproteobacteria bacterium]